MVHPSNPEPKPVTSCDELRAFVKELQKGYEMWYVNSVKRVMFAYYGLQILSLLSGFLTALITALTTADTFVGSRRIVLIMVPLIGSLAGTVLLQFRLYDLWQVREDARIAFQDLASEGRKRLAAAASQEECFKIHESLQLRATEIEIEQKRRFFALARPNFIATFGHKHE